MGANKAKAIQTVIDAEGGGLIYMTLWSEGGEKADLLVKLLPYVRKR